jgi:gliding motility-associated protein GldM
MLNFRNGVAGGALVAMVRLKAEMLNAEYEATNMLYKQISANDYSFDQVAVLCRPTSTYIMQGQKFDMIVNVGAYDSRNHFKATIGGQTFNSNDTGAVVYSAPGTTTGLKTVTGTVYVTKDGGTTPYPFSQSYYVAEPLAVFELTEMNVVYNGIDNPIKITVSGAKAHEVAVSVTDPSLADIFPAKRVKEMENGKEVIKFVRATEKTADAGYYVIFPKKAVGTIVVNASVRNGKGLTPMGSQNLRIKKIPDPKLYLGKYVAGSAIPINEFRTFKGATVKYGDDFAFHMKLPTVNKQTIDIARLQIMDKENTGQKWDPETLAIMEKVRPGYKITITANVTLPNGERRAVEGSFRVTR